MLGRYPGISAGEAAERTAMDKVAVSRAVSSLLRQRRLERRFASADRRRSALRLSEAGQRIYAQVVPFALAYERALLRPLGARERATLDRALRILLGRATEMGPMHSVGRRARHV